MQGCRATAPELGIFPGAGAQFEDLGPELELWQFER